MMPEGCLVLPGILHQKILSHAMRSQPKEAVGLLGGTAAGQVTLVLPLPNIASGGKYFIADPYAQFIALRQLESGRLQLLAIYHSHPDGGVEPSEEDLNYAKHWSCAHLIIAVSAGRRSYPELRAFRCVATGSMERVEVPVMLI